MSDTTPDEARRLADECDQRASSQFGPRNTARQLRSLAAQVEAQATEIERLTAEQKEAHAVLTRYGIGDAQSKDGGATWEPYTLVQRVTIASMSAADQEDAERAAAAEARRDEAMALLREAKHLIGIYRGTGQLTKGEDDIDAFLVKQENPNG